MPFQRVSKFLPLALVALLSACNGLGDGARPESMEIRRPYTSLLGSNSDLVFVCFPEQLQAVATDGDGRQGDFTTRAIWTSSNPEVAVVSNGEIQLPNDETTAYQSGVVIPKATGTATITAKFTDHLVATYEVNVVEPTAITVSPGTLTLARYSSSADAPVKLTAVLGGYPREVTTTAIWSFDEAQDSDTTGDIATISSTNGVIAAGKSTGDLTARARLPACPVGSPAEAMAADLKVAVQVRTLSSLSVAREFDAAAGLSVGTTEKFTVTGHFSDSDATQDLSSQIRFESADSAVAGGTSPANYVLAVKAGTTTVTPRYPANDLDDFPKITGPAQTVTAVDRSFQSFEVTPATATVAPFGLQQYHAIATYTDGSTQDITRHVTWSYPEDVLEDRDALLDAQQLISIGNTSYPVMGQVKSLQIGDSTSTIRVVRGADKDAVEKTVTFTVDAP